MAQVSRLIKTQAGSMLLRDEKSGDLTFEIAVSPAAGKLKGMKVEAGEGIAGWVAEHGEALVIPDVSKDDRFSDQFDRASSFITQSVLCVPVRSKDHVLGVIELVNGPNEKIFKEADL
ncbi:MAG: sensor domain-containing diguanylate cyclase, partial [Deltaproteobacteria bacterium]